MAKKFLVVLRLIIKKTILKFIKLDVKRGFGNKILEKFKN